MSRFLFVLWDGGGNVPPALALAARLATRGHSIRVLGERSLRRGAAAAGCAFRCFERAPEWADPRAQFSWPYLQGLWFGREAGEDLLSELDREGADAVVVDFVLLGALAAAELSGTPTAALVHTLYHLNVEGEWLSDWEEDLPLLAETRAHFGLDGFESGSRLWDRVSEVLVLVPRALDAPVTKLPKNVHYVGPILEPAPVTNLALPDGPGPLILVAFSTTYMKQEAPLQRVLDALAPLPVRGLLTLGPAVERGAVEPPPNVAVRRLVPHAAVLPQAGLVVTHAGMSTVMAALTHGVPLVCLPQGRDQGPNAVRVQACGAGLALSGDARPAEIRAAVERVLSSPGFGRAARHMAGVIRRYGNGARAVDRLEALAR